MSEHDYTWSWSAARTQAQPERAPDPSEVIANHERQRALETLRESWRKRVADAHTELSETFRAAAWAKAGHDVQAKPNRADLSWDFDMSSVPAGWPPGVADPTGYVREQLSQRGIRDEL